jgi:hypothetical protein
MNKNLFLLALFLLFPATTQCMKRANTIRPLTMQDIRNDRNAIYSKRFNSASLLSCTLDYTLFQEYWTTQPSELTKEQQKSFLLSPAKYYTEQFAGQKYSALGITTIAIKSERIAAEDINARGERKRKLLNKEHPEQVPFKKKKEHIKELLTLGVKPTESDRYLALLATYEEHGSLIITKQLLLQLSSLLSEIYVPQDILNYIALLMFKTELLL